MLDELLQRLELSPGGDVVTAVVQLADLVMLDVVTFHIVPVPYGQGEGTCVGVTDTGRAGVGGGGVRHRLQETDVRMIPIRAGQISHW